MTNATSELRIQVVDDEIIVTLPGSHYSVTYYKPAKSPQLLAKCISDRDDPRVGMRLSEFLASAWRLANDKARELGWGWVIWGVGFDRQIFTSLILAISFA
jgi:hypothetical protein